MEKIKNYLEPITQKYIFSAENAIQKKGLFNSTLILKAGIPLHCEKNRIINELKNIGVEEKFEIVSEIESKKVQQQLHAFSEIKNIIAIASGKGGVGKSTVAVNLALALRAQGAKVGILDADLYGPSQSTMLGGSQRPDSPDNKKLYPIMRHGLQSLSIGDLIHSEDDAMIWRGPMVTQTLLQLLRETLWQDLDYLILDLPPGTGDTQLTLAQQIPVSGAVIVTTPQEIALLDARKANTMFTKVEIPVLGIVENMSYHVCSQCNHRETLFGENGGAELAARFHLPLLGQIPLHKRIREQADNGTPTVIAEPDSDLARIYQIIALKTAAELAFRDAPSAPKIIIE